MLLHSRFVRLAFSLPVLALACSSPQEFDAGRTGEPDWVKDAVFYQIFPERFRNGDVSNDPIRSSLDYLQYVPESWQTSRWTKDWYAMDSWEKLKSDDVYASIFDRRFGGDMQGVLDQLPYLEDLGITAIWFNPVFAARSLHKYDGSSFHHVDPHFGPDPEGDKALMELETHDPSTWTWTSADRLFLEVVREARQRGIRIVLDGVWNHTGRGFFAFEDIRMHQDSSRYVEWFDIKAFDDPSTENDEFEYAGWFGYEALPEFANNEAGTDLHPDVKAYIFASTTRWMDPDEDGNTEDGIDGWRLDVAQEVPSGFWQEWNRHVRSINPDAYTVAEIWEPADTFVRENGFSAGMNYHGFSMPLKGFLIDGMRSASWFADTLEVRAAKWEEAFSEAPLNVIDSHDTPRLASMVVNRVQEYEDTGNENDYDSGLLGPRSDPQYDVGAPGPDDEAIMKLAILFQMSFPGSPIIYYGTEAGMWGGDDPDDRKPMVWSDLAFDAQEEGPFGPVRSEPVRFREDWFQFYRELIALHRSMPALSRGDIEWMDHTWGPMVLAFAKFHEGERVNVILNRSHESMVVPASELDISSTLFATGNRATMEVMEGQQVWVVPPLSGLVFEDKQIKNVHNIKMNE